MFLINAIEFVVNAEYVYRAILDKMQNMTSITCHQIKSFLFFFKTDMAMQIAESKEKMLPKIK